MTELTREFVLQRDVLESEFTLGILYDGMRFFGYTCEDTDRQLETFPERKVHGQSAIPRGRYRLTTSISTRFGKLMLEIKTVGGFSGVRIHGGNTAANTEGCPLLGSVRTSTGVQNCAERLASLLKIVQQEEAAGKECWITLK